MEILCVLSDHTAGLPNNCAFPTIRCSQKLSTNTRIEYREGGLSGYLVRKFCSACVMKPGWRYQLMHFAFYWAKKQVDPPFLTILPWPVLGMVTPSYTHKKLCVVYNHSHISKKIQVFLNFLMAELSVISFSDTLYNIECFITQWNQAYRSELHEQCLVLSVLLTYLYHHYT